MKPSTTRRTSKVAAVVCLALLLFNGSLFVLYIVEHHIGYAVLPQIGFAVNAFSLHLNLRTVRRYHDDTFGRRGHLRCSIVGHRQDLVMELADEGRDDVTVWARWEGVFRCRRCGARRVPLR